MSEKGALRAHFGLLTAPQTRACEIEQKSGHTSETYICSIV